LIREASAGSVEKSLLRLHNAERKKRNLPKLRLRSTLNRSAKAHAADMNTNDYFNHTGLNGSTPDQRIRAAGFTGRATGENIASGFTSARSVFRGWMNSPGHRRNIRSRLFNQVGFGKVGTYWVTNFGG
jgi:uncharacterized protein YkwD